MCVMISITSNLDNVQSNSLIVPCVSNTSEFQDVSVREFQFDENLIWESGAYDCSTNVVKTIFTLLQ